MLKGKLKEHNKHSICLEAMKSDQLCDQAVKTNTHSRQKSLSSHSVVFSAWQRWESEKTLTLAMVKSLMVRNRYVIEFYNLFLEHLWRISDIQYFIIYMGERVHQWWIWSGFEFFQIKSNKFQIQIQIKSILLKISQIQIQIRIH